MKKLLLVVVLTVSSTLLPCMTRGMMSLDDSALPSPRTQIRVISPFRSEPSSPTPVDATKLMPHSSGATRLYVRYACAHRAQPANSKKSQQTSSTAA